MATRLWLPTDLGTALVAWWDAQQGVTQSAGAVSQWADVVAGLPATQTTSALQPAYSATARNGKPGIVFTAGGGGPGTGNFLNFAATNFPQGSSASTVAWAGYTTTDSDGYVVGWGSGSAGRMRAYDNNTFIRFFEGATAYSAAEKTNTFDRFAVHQIAAGANPALKFNVDGGADQAAQATITYTTNNINGIIGRYPASAQAFWRGTIQQIVVCNRTLTTAERQQLEGWESWYDGKNGANLPANHPYKAAAPTVYVNDNTPVRSRRRRQMLIAA